MESNQSEPLCVYCRKPIAIGEIALAFEALDPDDPAGGTEEKGPAHQACQEAHGTKPKSDPRVA